MSRAANSIARFAHRNNIKRLRVIAMFINGGRQSAIDARYLAVKSVDFSSFDCLGNLSMSLKRDKQSINAATNRAILRRYAPMCFPTYRTLFFRRVFCLVFAFALIAKRNESLMNRTAISAQLPLAVHAGTFLQ